MRCLRVSFALRTPTVCGQVILFLVLTGTSLQAADWPSWGGQPSRNMAAETEKGLPAWYAPKGTTTDPAEMKNIKWVAKLGAVTCGSPVVSQGRVFIGTRGASNDIGILLCLDETTGRELGQFIFRKPRKGGEHKGEYGACSTPTVEGDRLYVVTPYDEVLCVNVKSWLASQAAPSADESDRHIAWKYDMADKLQVEEHHTASCGPLVFGDFVYICTGNGRFKDKTRPLYPLTPSLVAFNKQSGQLVARDDEQIGEQLWRGQWSSPSLGMVNGKAQIFFATGNGLCYGFEPVDPASKVAPDKWITESLRGPIVYFIDVEGKDTAGLTPAQYAETNHVLPAGVKPALPLEFRYSIKMPITTPIVSVPSAKVPDVPILKKIWWFDCLPPEYRNAPFYSQGCNGDGKIHPCDIIATPVFYRNRVYVTIGGDPAHGSKKSRGRLVCIDATKTGDVTHSGQVWSYDKLNATLTTVGIANGLLFVMDEASVVHCLDADTGQPCWTYALKSDRGEMASPLVVADGKVFVGKSILAAGRTLKVLGTIESSATTSCSTPCVANGVLYMVYGNRLVAVCDKGDKPPQGP